MRGAQLALVAYVACLAAGCATPEDAVAGSFHQAHDLTRGARETPFAVRDALDELDARLAMEPLDGCEIRDAPRVVLLDPDGREALVLDSPSGCRGASTARLDATPGVWRVLFEGNATVLASATLRELDHPEGRAYVGTR